jgi:hypothetical protein
MKGIKIDATNRMVTEVEVNGLSDMQKEVGGYIESAMYLGKQDHVLFVDEEGLLKEGLSSFYFNGRVFLGNGLIMGFSFKTGNNKDCKMSLKVIKDLVKFP